MYTRAYRPVIDSEQIIRLYLCENIISEACLMLRVSSYGHCRYAFVFLMTLHLIWTVLNYSERLSKTESQKPHVRARNPQTYA